jgi:predicted AlkP superfamily phosphohydrolase/phosphomutase
VTSRVLVIGLDGFEPTYADQLLDAGDLPALAARRTRDAHVLLEHGAAARTGLSWEHFWSGLTPDAAARWASVEFDPGTYRVWAEGARFAPFFADADLAAVVLDTPYADFDRAPGATGVVAWGSHDPGISGPASNPADLRAELEAHVGPYPASEWLYGCPWPSTASTEAMTCGLEAGVLAHGAAAKWLFTERFPDWDVAIVVMSELHAAAEGLWHGVDPTHPLHDHPSAPIAADGLRHLYQTIDRVVAELTSAIDASSVVFTMGGMGTNGSDAPSMVLLPELLFRWSLGRELLDVPDAWQATPAQAPRVEGDGAYWQRAWYPALGAAPRDSHLKRIAAHLPQPLLGRVRAARAAQRASARPVGYQNLDWIPATWYRDWWPQMQGFAIPSFYDGRVRVNLRGREADGLVDPSDYGRVVDEVEELVRACTDPRTGQSVVDLVERPGDRQDPMMLDGSTADLLIAWRGSALSFSHPTLGLIGPVPLRRTGGHTGPHGYASIAGPGVVAGDHGMASSFDVAPTIVQLASGNAPSAISGTSLTPRLLETSSVDVDA